MLIKYINNALAIDNYAIFYTIIVTGAVSIDGHRLFVEIKIDLNVTPAITISTCGKTVSLNNIKGEETVKVNLRTIDEAICIVDSTSPCIGQAINLDDKVPFLKSEVVGSKVVVVASKNEETTRIISTSCLLFQFRCNSCTNCLYTLKLYRNRSWKRKMTSSDNNCPQSKCNLRFLDQEGLEEKITMQRKRIEKECKRESRMKESETIELVDEDHLDLMEIIKSSNISVPANLELLWEQQMKQLSMKSSNGYRWDPRFFHSVLFITINCLYHAVRKYFIIH